MICQFKNQQSKILNRQSIGGGEKRKRIDDFRLLILDF